MTLTIVLAVVICIALLIFFYYVPFLLWVSAIVSGVHISLIQLFLMRIRKVPPHKIVDCLIEAHKAGLQTCALPICRHTRLSIALSRLTRPDFRMLRAMDSRLTTLPEDT